MNRRFRSFSPIAALTALLFALPSLAAADERRVERSFESASLGSVELQNLAGKVELVPAQGGELRVEATIHAEPSAGRSAAELLQALEVGFETRGDRLVVRALYPVDEHRRYHYPGSNGASGVEDNWLLSWLGGSSSGVRYQGKDVKVVSSAASGTATLWADFRIEVPTGVAARVENSVGRIRSNGVRADQNLDTASGDIEVASSSGALVLDTGSGDISASDHDGDVSADTGSGDVSLIDVRAEQVAIDTGSGDVSLLDCSGSLKVDTGSGDIRGRGLDLGSRLHADTGSGDVRLAGDFGRVRTLMIDTGSGDVVLDVETAPSVRLRVSTGSGDVEVDLPGMRVRQWKGEFVADIGSAEGKAVVDTGSGDVRIVTAGG